MPTVSRKAEPSLTPNAAEPREASFYQSGAPRDSTTARPLIHIATFTVGTLQCLQGKLVIQPPKTKKSARPMKIPKSLLSVLREHRTRQLAERLKAEHWQDADLVFCTSIGTYIEPRNVRRKLDELMKDSGMRYFRLHDVRHFFASLLLAQGVELKLVSELLGHSSIRITGDIHAHVMPAAKDAAIDMLDNLLNSGMTSPK